MKITEKREALLNKPDIFKNHFTLHILHWDIAMPIFEEIKEIVLGNNK